VVGLLAGLWGYAATLRYRNNLPLLWQAYMSLLLLLFSGGASFGLTAFLQTWQQDSPQTGALFLASSGLIALGFGVFVGLMWWSYKSLVEKEKRRVNRTLLAWGIILLTCAFFVWYFWGNEPALTLVLAVLAGVFLGIVIKKINLGRTFTRVIQITTRPEV